MSGDQLDLDAIEHAIRDDLETLIVPEIVALDLRYVRALQAVQGNSNALVAEVRRLRDRDARLAAMARETLDVEYPGFPGDPAGYEEAHALARALLRELAGAEGP